MKLGGELAGTLFRQTSRLMKDFQPKMGVFSVLHVGRTLKVCPTYDRRFTRASVRQLDLGV